MRCNNKFYLWFVFGFPIKKKIAIQSIHPYTKAAKRTAYAISRFAVENCHLANSEIK